MCRSMEEQPLFPPDEPIHAFGCGCAIVDAVDEGRHGLPETYWVLCEKHLDMNPEVLARREERQEPRS